MKSKKKKNHQPPQVKSVPELIPDTDPYWRIASDTLDPSKGRRTIERFDKFIIRYPQWADDILCGVPSYYAVLGVLRGVHPEELRRCYEREIDYSVYKEDTIEEAFAVLSDLQLRVQYDEFLRLFEASTLYAPPDEKKELQMVHDKYLRNAQAFRRLGELSKSHYDYVLLVAKGMPDIFEYSGLSRDCSDEEISKYSLKGDEICTIISSLVRDPVIREKFLFATYFFENMIEDKGKQKRNGLKKVWKTFSPEQIHRIMLLVLTKNKEFGDIIDRISKITSENHDWIGYIPPSKKSFLSVLNIDEDAFSLPKGELESLLRSKYRLLERTPTVNLAYTVLKNPTLRVDYFWLRDHYELMIIDEALEKEENNHLDIDNMEKMIAKTVRMLEKKFGNPFSKSGHY